MKNRKDETCVHFGNLEDCNCKNDPGECIYMDGIEPEAPAVRCPHYKIVEQTEGKAKYQSQIDTSYEMGQSAARTGMTYDVNRQTDEAFHRICTSTFRTPNERVECKTLMHYAWREGYEAESRQHIPAAPLSTPKLVLQSKRISENENSVDAYAYWDWMDNLTPMAAAAECAAGHWSEYQKDTFLERRQPDEKQAFEQMSKLHSTDSCHSGAGKRAWRAGY